MKQIIEEKKCTACHMPKPLDDFYKDKKRKDGHTFSCKKCMDKYVKGWIAINKKTYQKQRRKFMKEWQRKPKEIAKHKARAATRIALLKGFLQKKPCGVCGVTNVHAHHSDYSKPLIVVWLCPKHHSALHKTL